MNIRIIAVIVIFVTNFRFCQSRRYDMFTLYNIVPTDAEQLKFLQNVDKQKYIDAVFWKRPYRLYDDVQIIVNPTDKSLFLERARHFKMKIKVLINDLSVAFSNQSVRRYQRLRVETFSWSYYHTLDDINQWLTDLTLKYPSFVNMESIGKSSEDRDIYALSIQKSGAKEKVVVEGGIHGHEWVSPEFITYLIHSLIHASESGDQVLINLSNKYRWYLIPIVNPDGHEYTHKTDRLWRKNRRNLGNTVGVDLNRNFDNSFGKFGTSMDPNDGHYCGPMPFSESESKALMNYIRSHQKNLKFYFSIHAYGQNIIIPYSDRVKHVENFSEMENYGKQAIVKMQNMFNTRYTVGTTFDTMGTRISGNSASWVKKNIRIKYAFTLNLRDNGTFGYALPHQDILPTCKEALAGMVQLMTSRPRRVNLFSDASMIRGNLLLTICLLVLK